MPLTKCKILLFQGVDKGNFEYIFVKKFQRRLIHWEDLVMPRPPCKRRIGFVPNVTYYKPVGVPMSQLAEVVIQHDELEAIRLKDLLGEPQEEAAKKMNISQPTFHRLLTSAHEKIADALVNGKALRIQGGNLAIEETSLPPCGFHRRCMHSERKGCHNWGKETQPERDKGGAMKIAVTSVDGTMEGMVDERFGRSKKLIIYDQELGTHTVMDNAINMGLPQGAGIQAAQNVVNSGAKVLISGHLGPNAYRVLKAAGVEVYTATNMTVAQAIRAYQEGKLEALQGPDVSGHW